MWLTCCPEALKATSDVADLLSRTVATEKKRNHEYLAHQSMCEGLPLRGDGLIKTSIS